MASQVEHFAEGLNNFINDPESGFVGLPNEQKGIAIGDVVKLYKQQFNVNDEDTSKAINEAAATRFQQYRNAINLPRFVPKGEEIGQYYLPFPEIPKATPMDDKIKLIDQWKQDSLAKATQFRPAEKDDFQYHLDDIANSAIREEEYKTNGTWGWLGDKGNRLVEGAAKPFADLLFDQKDVNRFFATHLPENPTLDPDLSSQFAAGIGTLAGLATVSGALTLAGAPEAVPGILTTSLFTGGAMKEGYDQEMKRSGDTDKAMNVAVSQIPSGLLMSYGEGLAAFGLRSGGEMATFGEKFLQAGTDEARIDLIKSAIPTIGKEFLINGPEAGLIGGAAAQFTSGVGAYAATGDDKYLEKTEPAKLFESAFVLGALGSVAGALRVGLGGKESAVKAVADELGKFDVNGKQQAILSALRANNFDEAQRLVAEPSQPPAKTDTTDTNNPIAAKAPAIHPDNKFITSKLKEQIAKQESLPADQQDQDFLTNAKQKLETLNSPDSQLDNNFVSDVNTKTTYTPKADVSDRDTGRWSALTDDNKLVEQPTKGVTLYTDDANVKRNLNLINTLHNGAVIQVSEGGGKARIVSPDGKVSAGEFEVSKTPSPGDRAITIDTSTDGKQKISVSDNKIIHADKFEPQKGFEITDTNAKNGIASNVIIKQPDGRYLHLTGQDAQYAHDLKHSDDLKQSAATLSKVKPEVKPAQEETPATNVKEGEPQTHPSSIDISKSLDFWKHFVQDKPMHAWDNQSKAKFNNNVDEHVSTLEKFANEQRKVGNHSDAEDADHLAVNLLEAKDRLENLTKSTSGKSLLEPTLDKSSAEDFVPKTTNTLAEVDGKHLRYNGEIGKVEVTKDEGVLFHADSGTTYLLHNQPDTKVADVSGLQPLSHSYAHPETKAVPNTTVVTDYEPKPNSTPTEDKKAANQTPGDNRPRTLTENLAELSKDKSTSTFADSFTKALVVHSKIVDKLKSLGVGIHVVKNEAELKNKYIGQQQLKGSSAYAVIDGKGNINLVFVADKYNEKLLKYDEAKRDHVTAKDLFHEAVHAGDLEFSKHADNQELFNKAKADFSNDNKLIEFMRQEYGGWDQLNPETQFHEAVRAVIEGRYQKETSSSSFKEYLSNFLDYIKEMFTGIAKDSDFNRYVKNIERTIGIEHTEAEPIRERYINAAIKAARTGDAGPVEKYLSVGDSKKNPLTASEVDKVIDWANEFRPNSKDITKTHEDGSEKSPQELAAEIIQKVNAGAAKRTAKELSEPNLEKEVKPRQLLNNHIEDELNGLSKIELNSIAKEVGYNPNDNESLAKSVLSSFYDWIADSGKNISNKLRDIFTNVLNKIKKGALAGTFILHLASGSLHDGRGIKSSELIPIQTIENFAHTTPKVELLKLDNNIDFGKNNDITIHEPENSNKNITLEKGKIDFPKSNIESEVNNKPKVDFKGVTPSPDVVKFTNWISETSDNKGNPFVIADKKNGSLYVFDKNNNLVTKSPALFGKSIGDFDSPSRGKKDLSKYTDKDRTTPAGRFFGQPFKDDEEGPSIGFHELDKSIIGIHKIYLGSPEEQRQKRIKSDNPLDHRISYGCINVDENVMNKIITPTFGDNGGVVYVLPETDAGKSLFPKVLFNHPEDSSVKDDEPIDILSDTHQFDIAKKQASVAVMRQILDQKIEQKLVIDEKSTLKGLKDLTSQLYWLDGEDTHTLLTYAQDFVNTRSKQKDPSSSRTPIDKINKLVTELNVKADNNHFAEVAKIFPELFQGQDFATNYSSDWDIVNDVIQQHLNGENDNEQKGLPTPASFPETNYTPAIQQAQEDLRSGKGNPDLHFDQFIQDFKPLGHDNVDKHADFVLRAVDALKQFHEELKTNLLSQNPEDLSPAKRRQLLYELLSLSTDGNAINSSHLLTKEIRETLRDKLNPNDLMNPYSKKKFANTVQNIESYATSMRRLGGDKVADALYNLTSKYRQSIQDAEVYHKQVTEPYSNEVKAKAEKASGKVYNVADLNKIGIYAHGRQYYPDRPILDEMKANYEWLKKSISNTKDSYDKGLRKVAGDHMAILDGLFKDVLASDNPLEQYEANATALGIDDGMKGYVNDMTKFYEYHEPLQKLTTQYVYNRPHESIMNYLPAFAMATDARHTEVDMQAVRSDAPGESLAMGRTFVKDRNLQKGGLGATKLRMRALGDNRALVFNIKHLFENRGRINILDTFTGVRRREMSNLIDVRTDGGKQMAAFLQDKNGQLGRLNTFKSAIEQSWKNTIQSASYLSDFEVGTNFLASHWSRVALSGIHRFFSHTISNITPYIVQNIASPEKIGRLTEAYNVILKYNAGKLDPVQMHVIDRVLDSFHVRNVDASLDKGVSLDVDASSMYQMMRGTKAFQAIRSFDGAAQKLMMAPYKISDKISTNPMMLAEYLSNQIAAGRATSFDNMSYHPVDAFKAIDEVERFTGIGAASRRGAWLHNGNGAITLLRNIATTFAGRDINNATNFQVELGKVLRSDLSSEEKAKSMRYMAGIIAQTASFQLVKWGLTAAVGTTILNIARGGKSDDQEAADIKHLMSALPGTTGDNRKFVQQEISTRQDIRNKYQQMASRQNSAAVLGMTFLKDSLANMFIVPAAMPYLTDAFIHTTYDQVDAHNFNITKQAQLEVMQRRLKNARTLGDQGQVAQLSQAVRDLSAQQAQPIVFDNHNVIPLGGIYGGMLNDIAKFTKDSIGSVINSKPLSSYDIGTIMGVAGYGQADLQKYLHLQELSQDAQLKGKQNLQKALVKAHSTTTY